MIITIQKITEELKEDGTPKQIEWEAVGADGKDIKIKLYPALKLGDEWLHFEDRWDEFRNAQDKSYDIERANIKVEKGYWKPLIKATEVKNILKQQAIREIQDQTIDERQVSIEGQVSIKEAGENWRAGKFKDTDKEVEIYRLWIIDRLNKTFFGDKIEPKQGAAQDKPDKKAEVSKEVSADETTPTRDEQLAGMREYVRMIGWIKADKWKFNEFIQKTFHKGSIDNLTNEELIRLESALKEMAELL